MRILALVVYGAVSYAASMLSLLVLFGWLGGFGFFPIRLDGDNGTASISLGAVGWNTAIMVVFALYHSVFARTVVKRRTRLLLGRNLERATYNLISAVLAVLLCVAWRPMSLRVWQVSTFEAASALHVAYVVLWIAHLASIVLMGHNEFWGLRQIGFALRGQEYRPPPPVSRSYYLWTRSLLVITLALIPWASPVMTVGRLELSVFMTLYTALGAWLSNRDSGELLVMAAARSSSSKRGAIVGDVNPS